MDSNYHDQIGWCIAEASDHRPGIDRSSHCFCTHSHIRPQTEATQAPLLLFDTPVSDKGKQPVQLVKTFDYRLWLLDCNVALIWPGFDLLKQS